MHLELDDTSADLLARILTRGAERFGDSRKLEAMIACWDDVGARLANGERVFDLQDAEARYVRKACMGARSLLRKRSGEGGFFTKRAYRKQLDAHTPLFALILPER